MRVITRNTDVCMLHWVRTKPWLCEEKVEEEATIEKYFAMWQTKKVNLLEFHVEDRTTLTFDFVDFTRSLHGKRSYGRKSDSGGKV